MPAVLGQPLDTRADAHGRLRGRALRAGDVLPIGSRKRGREPFSRTPSKKVPGPFSPPFCRRAARGCASFAGPARIGAPRVERFTVSPRSDRMGYRLEGPVGARRHLRELISTRGADRRCSGSSAQASRFC